MQRQGSSIHKNVVKGPYLLQHSPNSWFQKTAKNPDKHIHFGLLANLIVCSQIVLVVYNLTSAFNTNSNKEKEGK